MNKLKDKVENNPAVFFLGALVVGFMAGIGRYWRVSGDLENVQPDYYRSRN